MSLVLKEQNRIQKKVLTILLAEINFFFSSWPTPLLTSTVAVHFKNELRQFTKTTHAQLQEFKPITLNSCGVDAAQ